LITIWKNNNANPETIFNTTMKYSKIRIFNIFIIAFFFVSCSKTSKVTTADKTREDLRDVFVLTILVQDYLKKTNGEEFNLEKLFARDSLGRISTNFESIRTISRGGHIAIQYKFSENRNNKIEFTENEKQMKEIWKVIEKENLGNFDGEIQFDYGERFYNFRKIIIEKN
jgi:hypothetical protein